MHRVKNTKAMKRSCECLRNRHVEEKRLSASTTEELLDATISEPGLVPPKEHPEQLGGWLAEKTCLPEIEFRMGSWGHCLKAGQWSQGRSMVDIMLQCEPQVSTEGRMYRKSSARL